MPEIRSCIVVGCELLCEGQLPGSDRTLLRSDCAQTCWIGVFCLPLVCVEILILFAPSLVRRFIMVFWCLPHLDPQPVLAVLATRVCSYLLVGNPKPSSVVRCPAYSSTSTTQQCDHADRAFRLMLGRPGLSQTPCSIAGQCVPLCTYLAKSVLSDLKVSTAQLVQDVCCFTD